MLDDQGRRLRRLFSRCWRTGLAWRDFDALNDSIANGSINEVEVPYRLVPIVVGIDLVQN